MGKERLSDLGLCIKTAEIMGELSGAAKALREFRNLEAQGKCPKIKKWGASWIITKGTP